MNDQSEQMQKITDGLKQACDEVNEGCSRSVDALVKATSAASKGYEEFSRNLGTLVQDSMARALGASKTMLGAKNLQDVADTQTEFMNGLLESWMVGAGRLSQISARVTQQAFEPVMKHANDAMSKAVQKTQQSQAA